MNEHAAFSPHRNFADNLRALCTQHGSIAAVCRALGMNRQQFNKYLAGSTLPSATSLARICSFFTIDSEKLFQDPRRFQSAPSVPNAGLELFGRLPFDTMGFLAGALGRMQGSSLRTGCYHVYYPWPRDVTKCMRDALFVYRRGGSTLFTRFTKYRPAGQRQRYYLRGRHDGIVLDSDKSRFLLAINRKGLGDMSMISIGPESTLSSDFLSGLALVTGPAGAPMALRATLQYCGAASELKQTIAQAGILPLADASIPAEVRHSVSGVAQLEPFSLLDSFSP